MTQATAFFDVANLALTCVCDQMDSLSGADGIPENYGCPCSQFVSVGEPALDCCVSDGCDGPDGQLTVHVENVFPSDDFPNPTTIFEPCKAGTWVAALVVTVARCAPTMDEHGNPHHPMSLSANAQLMAIDQWAVLTALSCCLVNDPVPGKRKRRVQIAGSRPLVTSGGCAAIEVRAFVEAGVVCSCQDAGS